jgi:hypothetical protein
VPQRGQREPHHRGGFLAAQPVDVVTMLASSRKAEADCQADRNACCSTSSAREGAGQGGADESEAEQDAAGALEGVHVAGEEAGHGHLLVSSTRARRVSPP